MVIDCGSVNLRVMGWDDGDCARTGLRRLVKRIAKIVE
jgi:hypothetical protein